MFLQEQEEQKETVSNALLPFTHQIRVCAPGPNDSHQDLSRVNAVAPFIQKDLHVTHASVRFSTALGAALALLCGGSCVFCALVLDKSKGQIAALP